MAISTRISGKGSLLDNGVAALAALSAGFAAYAMPEGLFGRLILASHVPDVLAAAQPPLGMKARLAVIVAVVILAYAFVWTLMRALDSIGAPRAAAAEPEAEAAPPRLRRADAHPDAPSRRPIFAGRDLGEPAFDDEPFELEEEDAIETETAVAKGAEMPPEPGDWPDETELPRADDHPVAPRRRPILVHRDDDEPAFDDEPLELAPEDAIAPEAESEPEPRRRAEPLPSFLVPQDPEPEVAQSAAPPPVPTAFGEPAFREDEEEEEPEEDESGEADDLSLAHLMKRFESGLSRKQQALAPALRPAAEAEPDDRLGHRLRSAITDLGKISAPGR